MNTCVILVDNSKIYIEDSKYSARQKGVKKSMPDERDPVDPSWRINLGRMNGPAVGQDHSCGYPGWFTSPPNDSV